MSDKIEQENTASPEQENTASPEQEDNLDTANTNASNDLEAYQTLCDTMRNELAASRGKVKSLERQIEILMRGVGDDTDGGNDAGHNHGAGGSDTNGADMAGTDGYVSLADLGREIGVV